MQQQHLRFLAPEILEALHCELVDVWGTGASMAILLAPGRAEALSTPNLRRQLHLLSSKDATLAGRQSSTLLRPPTLFSGITTVPRAPSKILDVLLQAQEAEVSCSSLPKRPRSAPQLTEVAEHIARVLSDEFTELELQSVLAPWKCSKAILLWYQKYLKACTQFKTPVTASGTAAALLACNLDI